RPRPEPEPVVWACKSSTLTYCFWCMGGKKKGRMLHWRPPHVHGQPVAARPLPAPPPQLDARDDEPPAAGEQYLRGRPGAAPLAPEGTPWQPIPFPSPAPT